MGFLTDILNALDRWAKWKKIRETPSAIDELTRRVAALEERLKRAPGEACPSCGAFAFRVEKSAPIGDIGFARLGVRQYHWKCTDCGYTDVTTETPKRAG